MNFSDSFQASKYLVRYSPDGRFLASCSQHRLVIRDAGTLQILHLHTCLDPVQSLEWSPDSSLIMCGMYKRGVAQVWSLEQPEWTCKIDEGSSGMVSCQWAPDSRSILTTSDFLLRITLWSLVDKSISYIKHPKLAQGGTGFSRNGQFMALAERRDCKDFVSIFDCQKWCLVKHFEVGTKDLAGLAWSPDGRVICVWDAIVDYKVLMYAMDGRCIGSYSAYNEVWQYGLGLKTVAWSPMGQFLAVGSYDEKVRILNHVTWKTVAEHHHPVMIEDTKVVLYSEVEQKLPFGGERNPATLLLFPMQSKYVTVDLPAALTSVKVDPEKPNPKLGVGTLLFSPDARYLATLNDNVPHVVWIWDVTRLCLAVVLKQLHPVKDIKWDPVQPRLAICTGNDRLYVWSPAGCISVCVPNNPPIGIQRLQWHPTGSALALIGQTHFTVCYLSMEE